MQNNYNQYGSPKSATTAGVLGIFLGNFGVHQFYLGNKKLAIIHLCLGIAAVLLIGVPSGLTAAWTTSLTGYVNIMRYAGMLSLLSGLGSLIAVGNGIWALVESIMILSKGDAGLAAQGIPVATPVAAPYPQQPMNNPYPQQPAQPMNNPYPQQPAQPPMENPYAPQADNGQNNQGNQA